jgi:hypothetical protein
MNMLQVNMSKFHLKFLVTVLFISNLLVPNAFAKNPSKCGSIQIGQNGTPSPVLCSNGSPNLNAKKILSIDNPKIMALNRTSSEILIIKAICADQVNSTNPSLIAAYTYQYALNEWSGKRTDPSTMMNNLVSDDNFCENSSQPKSSAVSKPLSDAQIIAIMTKCVKKNIKRANAGENLLDTSYLDTTMAILSDCIEAENSTLVCAQNNSGITVCGLRGKRTGFSIGAVIANVITG